MKSFHTRNLKGAADCKVTDHNRDSATVEFTDYTTGNKIRMNLTYWEIRQLRDTLTDAGRKMHDYSVNHVKALREMFGIQ